MLFYTFADCNPFRIQSLPSASSATTARFLSRYYNYIFIIIIIILLLYTFLLCAPAFIIANVGLILYLNSWSI